MSRRRPWAVAASALGLAFTLGAALGIGAGVAAASGGCGSLPSGNAVYLDCSVPSGSAPYATLGDGKQIDLAMGPNALFSGGGAGGDIEAVECEYSTGTGPGDPPDTNFCDAQTLAGGFPYNAHADGSFDYRGDQNGDAVTVFALPDATLSAATITCDASHPCVWYVGENYNDFKAPHVFSNPFVVTAAGGGGTRASAGAAPSSASSPTTAVPTSAGATSAGATSAPQLAYTGPAPLQLWLAGIGLVLLVTGRAGRQRLLRDSP